MFSGDGLIHVAPLSGGPDIRTIPAPNAGTPAVDGDPDTGIGAMDFDFDGDLWVSAYQPRASDGQIEIFELDPSDGTVLRSFAIPFGGGGVGCDTLDWYQGRIYTDAGEPLPTLHEYDENGVWQATYNLPVSVTGIAILTDDTMIATDLGYLYYLTTTTNRWDTIATSVPLEYTLIEDIAVLGDKVWGAQAGADGWLREYDIATGLQTHSFQADSRLTNHGNMRGIAIQPEGINLGCEVVYTKGQAVEILKAAKAKDPAFMLRAQLLAAILNVNNGAEHSNFIDDIIALSIDWLAANGCPSGIRGRDKAYPLALKDVLDAYNNCFIY
jgi:hypothetical protein